MSRPSDRTSPTHGSSGADDRQSLAGNRRPSGLIRSPSENLLGDGCAEVRSLTSTAIRPYDLNPRFNDQAVDGVASSLQEFGFRQPIVVDADGVNLSTMHIPATARLGGGMVFCNASKSRITTWRNVLVKDT